MPKSNAPVSDATGMKIRSPMQETIRSGKTSTARTNKK